MSPDKQRIAIAEACGWKIVAPKRGFPPGGGEREIIPNYLKDLNAMHEAESILSPEQRYIFDVKLSIKCGNDYHEYHSHWSARKTHATAAQRAEAFLRAIGKWEEETKSTPT